MGREAPRGGPPARIARYLRLIHKPCQVCVTQRHHSEVGVSPRPHTCTRAMYYMSSHPGGGLTPPTSNDVQALRCW